MKTPSGFSIRRSSRDSSQDSSRDSSQDSRRDSSPHSRPDSRPDSRPGFSPERRLEALEPGMETPSGFSMRRSSRDSRPDSRPDSSPGFSPERRQLLLAAAASRSRGPIRSTDTPPEDVSLKRETKKQPTAAKKKKGEATHMLLYLNEATFVGELGELFAEEVRCALANGFPMVMMHENDMLAGGCEFARFFVTTPQDLISSGLYTALAYAWYPDPFRQVSVALVALAFGAEEPQSMSVVSQFKRLGKRAAKLSERVSMSTSTMTSRRRSTNEVSAPSITIAPAVEPLNPEAQAGEPAADSTPSIAGTLHMRS